MKCQENVSFSIYFLTVKKYRENKYQINYDVITVKKDKKFTEKSICHLFSITGWIAINSEWYVLLS